MARADFPNDEAWLRSLGIDRETNPNNPSSWKPDLQARWTDHINTLAPERQAKLTVERPGAVVRPIDENLNTIPANGPTSPEPSSAPTAQAPAPVITGSYAGLPDDYVPSEEEKVAGAAFRRKYNLAYHHYGTKTDAKKATKELESTYPVLQHFGQLKAVKESIRDQLSRIPGMRVGTDRLPTEVPEAVAEVDKPKAQRLLDRSGEITKATTTLANSVAGHFKKELEFPKDPLPQSLRFDHLLAPIGGTAPANVDENDWGNLTPEAHKLALEYIDSHNDFTQSGLDANGALKSSGIDHYLRLHDMRQKIEKSILVSNKKADKEDAEMKVASALKNYPYGVLRSIDAAPRTNPVTESIPTVFSPAPSSEPAQQSNLGTSHEQKAEGHISNYIQTYKSVMDRVGRTVSGLSSGDMSNDERSSLIDSLHQATTHYTQHLGDERKATDLVRLKLRDMPLNPEYANEKDPKAKWGTGRMLDQ